MMVKSRSILSCLVAGLVSTGCASAIASVGSSNPELSQVADVQSEIEAIISKPQVARAFQSIEEMDARNIDRLIAMTEIPAPPFQEAARAKDFANRLTALGLTDVSIDQVGNVIARRKGVTGGRTVAVVAHIDTVFPPETDVTVRREDDVFFAPGIGDNTRGLVVLLSVAEVMQIHNIDTADDILFIGSVGEEGLGDLRGVRHLFRDGGSRIDSFIAIDGGSTNRVVTKAVGSNRYRVTYQGPGGHSYGAFGRAHPHQALAQAIVDFTVSARKITKNGPKATFSIGRIGGGTSINSIPFESWLEVDMRSADFEKLSLLDAAFKKAVTNAVETENENRSAGDALTVDIKSVGKRPTGATDHTAGLVMNASAALRKMGMEPDLRASSTDASIPMSIGVPAVTMSRGGVTKNSHAPDESWENKNADESIKAVLITLLAEADVQ